MVRYSGSKAILISLQELDEGRYSLLKEFGIQIILLGFVY